LAPYTVQKIQSGTRKLSYCKDDRAMSPIYGCPENFRESLSTLTATFAEFLMGFCSDRSYECAYKFEVVALPIPEIIAIAVLGRVANPQSWGRRGRRGSGMVPLERALESSYRPSVVTFHLSLRVSEILPLLCSSTPLFPIPPLVSPKFPHVPLGVGGWSFGYEERRCWANCTCT